MKYVFMGLMVVWGFFGIVNMYTGGNWRSDIILCALMYLIASSED